MKRSATEKIRRVESRFSKAERFNVAKETGLSTAQVELRNKQGLSNKVREAITKTGWEIFKQNFLSFFNILLYGIAAAMIAVRYFSGLFFLVILAANILIGFIQDIRARRTLEKLSILSKQTNLVVRNGEEIEIDSDHIVLDDILILKLGDQVSVDGVLLSGSLKVNESLLTGESEHIDKNEGDYILSGSFVTSGYAHVLVDRVGKARYAQTLQTKARAFKRPKSQLLASINQLFKVIGIFVIIIGLLMILTNFVQNATLIQNVKSVSGSLVSMIPSGMYLLTSMTLAVSVIRLGKKRTLVQEMYSIEMLARVDVLCLDKTGTLTDGTMSVKDVYKFDEYEKEDMNLILGSFFLANSDSNATAEALKNYFKTNEPLEVSKVIHFSSHSKFSAVQFRKNDSYVLGAAQYILSAKEMALIKHKIEEYSSKGFRVLTLAHTKKSLRGERCPKGLKPVALIILEDHIRPEAIETIRWFENNGVKIKIISGDDAVTVGQISKTCGVVGADHPLDVSSMSDEELIRHASQYSVFGRVTPEQKEMIIRQLQSEGQIVAMIGDGVNDILALKAADCSIAMAEGSGAARGASHLIIEQNFDVLPSIVDEGRRAINNLQLTWSLFLGKTLFSIIMSTMFLITAILGPAGAKIVYPFTTQNMYIWEIGAIGMPAFFISLQPNMDKIKGSFMGKVVLKALPGAISIVIAVILIFLLQSIEQRQPGTTYVFDETARTMATLTMSLFSFVILFRTCLPFTKYRLTLFITIFTATLSIVLIAGFLRLDLFNIYYKYIGTANVIQLVLINIFIIIIYVILVTGMDEKGVKYNEN